MSKEMLLMVDSVSNEKGIDKNSIFHALELALASATKKRFNPNMEVRVAIDRVTGEYDTFRAWDVIADDAEIENKEAQIPLSQAVVKNPSVTVGGKIEEPMQSVEFGRIAAQTAKQVIMQKVREAERA